MITYKVIVAYDGTDFCGWQQQSYDLSVQSCLNNSFQNAFGLTANILGASRTDSGVHALGQVARLKTDLNLGSDKILKIWNRTLPRSILIRKIERVSDNFYPFHNVLYKTYYYHLFLKQPLPFISRYGWFYSFINQVDFYKFESALNLYVGEHDFTSFCKLDKDSDKSCIRKIDKISLKKFDKLNMLRVEITGKSFLRFQIRRMVGYALDIARRKNLPIEYLNSLLNNPNSRQQLVKAESCGLCLRKVVYKDNEVNSK